MATADATTNSNNTKTPTADEVEDAILSARYGDLDDLRSFINTFGPTALADARDDNGNTVLHMAAANGHVDILTYILPLLPPSTSSTPSPLAAPNHAGSTPLHWAALNKQLAAAQALVSFDGGPGTGAALVDVKNNAGRSPLGEAENAGWDDGAVWLVSVMDLSNAGQPSEGPAEEGVEEGGEGEGEGDVKIAAKAGVNGRPVTVEITDAEGRVASMTLEDLKKDVDSRG